MFYVAEVGEGRGGGGGVVGRKFVQGVPGLRISFEMPRIKAKGSLNKEYCTW